MFILDDIVKGVTSTIGKQKAGKEQKRAQDEEAAGQFKSDENQFKNLEKTREARAGALVNGLGSLFGGKYAGLVGNGVRENLMAPRDSTAFKHAVIDPTKGNMWSGLGNTAGNALSSAGSMMAGGGLLQGLGLGGGGAQATSLLPKQFPGEEG